jgi:RNA polymerase sigma-70 factor (ECF subfamily)
MIQRDLSSLAGLPALSDAELVHLAQEGSLEAFTVLYERYFPVVFSRVRYLVPEQDTEDVIQEIFITVMKSLKTFRGTSQFGTWLRTLTNRRVADYYRRRRLPEMEIDESLGDNDPRLVAEKPSVTLDESILLREALRSLPEDYREVLLLRFAEGMKFDEIARLRGQSLEAVKSLFRRAVVAIRKQVGGTNG